MNDILFVTLARGGSKGAPHKHVRNLGGKPVIAWTIEAVKRSQYYDKNYVVSSDDIAILTIASRKGATIIHRPKELAQDDTPTLPALQHAIRSMEDYLKTHFKYVIEVRATSPLKNTDDIDGVVRLLITTGAESVIGVTSLEDHHPARAKWLDEQGYIHDFVPEPESGRRQDCQPPAYIRNGTIYGLRAPVTKLFGHDKSIGYVMPAERSVNIDTEMDFELCKLLIATR